MEQSKRLYALEHEKIPKLLLRYSLPSVVGTMVNALYNIVDRIFIGQGVGDDAIAGLAITFPILIFAQAFGMLVGSGASVRIAILLGRKDEKLAERVLGNAIFLTFFFNAMVCTLGYIFMDPLLRTFGATETILPYAKQYLSIVLAFNVFADLTFSYNAIIRSTGYPLKAMTTMLIGSILNCLLDPLFIFVFHWGIAGAAWATNISMVVSATFVMSHFFNKKSVLHFKKEALALSWKTMRSIVVIGVAPFSMMLVNSVINVVLNRSFGFFGTTEAETNSAIAAYGIIIGIAQLFIQFMVGISLGAQPIMSYNLGAGRPNRSINTYYNALALNAFVATIGFIIANFFPNVFVKPFNPGPHLMELTNMAIGIVFLAFPLISIQITTVQFFQSLGRASKAMFLTLTRQIIYFIPALLIVPRVTGLGLKGVWYAMPIADTLSGITALVMLMISLPKIKKQFPEKTLPNTALSETTNFANPTEQN